MSSTKQTKYLISAASLVMMFVFLALYVRNGTEVFLIIGVIAMSVSYQLIVRLFIGIVCEGLFKDGVDYDNSGWFETSDSEEGFYRRLNIRRWKGRLPEFEETDFSLKKHGVENLIIETCRTEVRHEVNMIASFVSLFLGVFFGRLWIFFVIALVSALIDFVFVAVQRYNRPRMIKIASKQRRKFFEQIAADEPEEDISEYINASAPDPLDDYSADAGENEDEVSGDNAETEAADGDTDQEEPDKDTDQAKPDGDADQEESGEDM